MVCRRDYAAPFRRMHKRDILRGDACLRGKAVAPLAPPPAL
jgi:hypothetical protein